MVAKIRGGKATGAPSLQRNKPLPRVKARRVNPASEEVLRVRVMDYPQTRVTRKNACVDSPVRKTLAELCDPRLRVHL